MAKYNGKQSIYDVADEFRNLCLTQNRSLLWPDHEVWSLENLNSLKTSFIDNPNEGQGTFLEKWKIQLDDCSEEVHRLATELLGFYHLFHNTGKTNTKLNQLQEIVSWKLSHDPPELSGFQKAFDASGIGNPGTYYVTSRYEVVGYFLMAFIEVKKKNIDALNDLEFKEMADLVALGYPTNADGARNVLMHLLFPEKYERSASNSHRELIRKKYEDIATLPDDLDEALFIIRNELSESYGNDFDFYDEDVQSQWSDRYVWDEETTGPVETINEAEATIKETHLENSPKSFPLTEPNYWIEKTIPHRSAALSNAIQEEGSGDSAFQYELGKHLWSPSKSRNGADVYQSMREVKPGDIVFHLTDNKSFVGTSRVKNTFTIRPDVVYRGNVGPSAYDPNNEHPSYIIDLEDYTEYEPDFHRSDFFESFQMKSSLVTILEAGFRYLFFFQNPRNGNLQLNQGMYLSKAPKVLVSALQNGYWDAHGKDFNPLVPNGANELESSEELLAPSIKDLSERTYTDESELKKLIALLEEKKQVILEGSPGSGKTFLADALGRYLTGNSFDVTPNEQFEMVQFHQSYGYEDFVHGIRPETDGNGQLRYELRDGVFKRICQLAEASDKKFVIVVDEINRGNLSRIFGELMLLLEYRDKEVSLAYSTDSEDKFKIPENVYLIGTMNTTDRSLAQIDYALRRRFYFYRLMPLIEEDAPVLRKWIEGEEIEPSRQDYIVGLFIGLNTKLQQELGEHFQVGQSYFMNSDISEDAYLENTWNHSIMPLLEEYFYARRDRHELLSQFSIENLSSFNT